MIEYIVSDASDTVSDSISSSGRPTDSDRGTSVGTTHHLCALGVARSESLVTLSYRVPEERWAASEADARAIIASFDLAQGGAAAGVAAEREQPGKTLRS